MTEYNINQPQHKVVNQVIRNLEDYLFDNGTGVQFGDVGRGIIESLIDAYCAEFSKMYDANAKLDFENQRLRKELKGVADKARNSQQQGQILIAMQIEEVLRNG